MTGGSELYEPSTSSRVLVGGSFIDDSTTAPMVYYDGGHEAKNPVVVAEVRCSFSAYNLWSWSECVSKRYWNFMLASVLQSETAP